MTVAEVRRRCAEIAARIRLGETKAINYRITERRTANSVTYEVCYDGDKLGSVVIFFSIAAIVPDRFSVLDVGGNKVLTDQEYGNPSMSRLLGESDGQFRERISRQLSGGGFSDLTVVEALAGIQC